MIAGPPQPVAHVKKNTEASDLAAPLRFKENQKRWPRTNTGHQVPESASIQQTPLVRV
jgi:hypothetical protein